MYIHTYNTENDIYEIIHLIKNLHTEEFKGVFIIVLYYYVGSGKISFATRLYRDVIYDLVESLIKNRVV